MTVQKVKCEVNHFEEPGAVIPHAKICEGGSRVTGCPTAMVSPYPTYPSR